MEIKKNPLYTQITKGYQWNKLTAYGNPIPQKGVAKKYRAFLLITCSGIQGVTENEILITCNLSNGRNYPNLLEDELKIELIRDKDKNPDGIGFHFRYALASKEDTQKVLNLINKHNPKLLPDWRISDILELYPVK